jgi:hypothetical protein
MNEQNKAPPTHAPEPWKIGEWSGTVIGKSTHEGPHVAIGTGDGGIIALCGPVSEPQSTEDARRIIACVNACKGIPTEELEQVKSIDDLSALAYSIEVFGAFRGMPSEDVDLDHR